MSRRLRPRSVAVAALLLAAAGIAATSASRLIVSAFPDRPMPRDLLLDVLPYLPRASYVADATVWLAMLVALVVFWRRARHRIPEGVAMIAVMYILRAPLTVLTPLASPHGTGAYGFMPAQFGMIPSGHSANVTLCALLVAGVGRPWEKRLAVALAVAEWSALLLSRGHYSIDIVVGVLLACLIWAEWTRGRLFAPLKGLVDGRAGADT